ncbi:MAG: glycoside hydrolase family 125 protein [Chitinophagales bacterium]
MNRRKFIASTAATAALASLPTSFVNAFTPEFTSRRPQAGLRRFTSDSVEALITEVKQHCKSEELGWMFENCFPNTLDTTVFFETKNAVPDTYIITGDINAMWLRDSSAQVNPYLPLCKDDKKLSAMVEGLIRRQTDCILLDPYANAFYKSSSKVSPWFTDNTAMKPGVHERKWELDSLCYCIRLAYQYWSITGNAAAFTPEWYKAMKLVISTMQNQQRKKDKGNYRFLRKTDTQSDTLPGAGYGNPCRPTGMICSAFRNSDDAAIYLYNIPENLFAVTVLRQLAEILDATGDPEKMAATARELAEEVEKAVNKYGVGDHPEYGKIYAYECDGFGNYVMMDDAGVPGLITIPYLGYRANDELYYATRKFSLSDSNPYFYQSKIAEGLGSPHLAWSGDMIWPMGIVGRGITATTTAEIQRCLTLLTTTHADTGFMHEGFQKDKPDNYTRKWFAWANSFFGEFVWKVYREHPELL